MKSLVLIIITLLIWTSSAFAFTLKWTDNSTNETGFHVYRMIPNEPTFTLIGDVGPDITTFSDTNQTVESCYEVSAFNVVGESSRVRACANIPPAPGGLILFLP